MKSTQVMTDLKGFFQHSNSRLSVKEFTSDKTQIRAATEIVAAFYIWSLFGSLSLLYTNQYYNIGDAKFYYFKYLSIMLLPLLGMLCICWFIRFWKDTKPVSLFFYLRKELSVTDWLVLCYGLILLLSFTLSSDRAYAVTGADGWYMGVVTQLVLIAIYFICARLLHPGHYLKRYFLIVTTIVYLLAVLNRMGIDPLNLYEELGIQCGFLSTIGQPTWYSSYLCTTFPIGCYLFWNCTNRRSKLLYGGYCMLIFSTLVTQNSDSAYIGLLLVLLVLFCLSFHSVQKLMNFLLLIELALISFRIMGILQFIFAGHVFRNAALSMFATKSPCMLILLLFWTGLLILVRWLHHTDRLSIQRLQFLPKVAIIAAVTVIVLMVLLIVCVTNNWIPESLSFLRYQNYLNFTNTWGDLRGINWTYTIRLYHESPILTQLFGCGPDCYYPYMYAHYGEQMNAFWGEYLYVYNAHNEWLNSLLTVGILGFVSYAGIFLSIVIKGLHSAKYSVQSACANDSLAIVLCVVCYMGHNLFCYQQIVCTPIIFGLMGIGAGMLRKASGIS